MSGSSLLDNSCEQQKLHSTATYGRRCHMLICISILFFSVILLGSVCSTTYFYLHQMDIDTKISHLEASIQDLQALCQSQSQFDEEEGLNEIVLPHPLGSRNRRQTGDDHTEPPLNCSCQSRRHKASGAHLYASINRDRLVREQAEGLPTVGSYNENGFTPNSTSNHGNIYRIWEATNWTDPRVFQINSDTGKVRVLKTGLYLLYGQIMFHGPSARKSFGIHVNDELVPFLEAISFDMGRHHRERRSIIPATGQQSMDTSSLEKFLKSTDSDMESVTDDDLKETRRTKRSTSHATYNLCNTQGVVHLNRGDEVFLKSLESGRTIIDQRALTFWGLVRL